MTLTRLVSQMRRKDRTRLRGSTGRPVRVVNTSPVLEDEPESLAGFLDVAGHPVSDQTLGWHGDELGDEQFPLPRADGDAQEF